jgi:hypothetical protein
MLFLMSPFDDDKRVSVYVGSVASGRATNVVLDVSQVMLWGLRGWQRCVGCLFFGGLGRKRVYKKHGGLFTGDAGVGEDA